MKKTICMIALLAITIGCTPVERVAYDTVVGAKAFLDKSKAQHPECASAQSVVCADIAKAVSAKDALIDAAEVYCSGADFNNGGSCNPITKSSPGYQQAVDKLKAAIAGYNQSATDLKGVL